MSTRESVECPVCNKLFESSKVEDHVNKCLFLSAQAGSSSAKLHEDEVQFSPPAKRMKTSDSRLKGPDLLIDKNDRSLPLSAAIDSSVPLAEQMRPCDFTNYVGQKHVLGQSTVLRSLLDKRDIPSMILWGPPGCGKTTLAHIIAKQCRTNYQDLRFIKLSATMSGVNDIKEAVKVAKNEMSFKRRTVLFMDEIHRFNKLQQDIFLPHVENGTIILIGATTENPSFSLNSALLSRCRVIVLEKLQTEDLIQILINALQAMGGVIVNHSHQNHSHNESSRILVDDATVKWLAEMCDGDARIALNSLQLALQSKYDEANPVTHILLDDIKDGIKRSHLLYDKKGEEHYNIISAVHKSIRASDDNAALYWVTRMLEGGEDPIFIARRLVRAASEDIGLADPMALTLAVSAMQGCQLLGMPECDVILAQCAIYLARAPKSTQAYMALLNAKKCISEHQGPLPSVPLHLRNAPTRLMKDLGYGKGYNTAHKNVSNLTYLPEEIKNVNFFRPS